MLCGRCQTQWDAWTTYQAPIGRWKQYPISVARSVEIRKALHDDREALIDWQCRMIRRICLEQHQAEELPNAA